MIPWGAQYGCLLPKITMPHNHWALLVDLHTEYPFPLVLVGDFQLEDTIFPGTLGNSLLYNSEHEEFFLDGGGRVSLSSDTKCDIKQ